LKKLKFQLLFLSIVAVTLACRPVWSQETAPPGGPNGVEDKSATHSVNNRPLVFLANGVLPPMTYSLEGRKVGIVVDIAKAIQRHFSRPVRLKYMNWAQAQQLVLKGEADALLHMNPSEERKKRFDFSDGLLESEFSIFINHSRKDIYHRNDLSGLQVGVLNKGLVFNLLNQDPLINLVTFPEILSGYHSLKKGELDAVVVDRQVGVFLLAENNIEGIRITGDPIDKSTSAIAVRKGNTGLLLEINKALAEIKQNGTYTQILNKWQPKEVVFQTKEKVESQQKMLLALGVAAAVAAVIILFIMAWNRGLKRRVAERTAAILLTGKSLEAEIDRRKKIEHKLRESRDYLKNLTDSIGDVVFSVKMPERKMEWINDRSKILGYTLEECLGKGTDFFYARRDDYLAIGKMLAKAISEGTDIIHTEAD
jgi:ABC-type amino acid transport substrate-binding protein